MHDLYGLRHVEMFIATMIIQWPLHLQGPVSRRRERADWKQALLWACMQTGFRMESLTRDRFPHIMKPKADVAFRRPPFGKEVDVKTMKASTS